MHECLLIAHFYKRPIQNEELDKCNLEVDFIECHHDSANLKQVWFALTALAILFLPVCASQGEKIT